MLEYVSPRGFEILKQAQANRKMNGVSIQVQHERSGSTFTPSFCERLTAEKSLGWTSVRSETTAKTRGQVSLMAAPTVHAILAA